MFTCTLALTTSIGLVTVEAVAAARGPAMACKIRWGQSLGASLESCSVEHYTCRQVINNSVTQSHNRSTNELEHRHT